QRESKASWLCPPALAFPIFESTVALGVLGRLVHQAHADVFDALLGMLDGVVGLTDEFFDGDWLKILCVNADIHGPRHAEQLSVRMTESLIGTMMLGVPSEASVMDQRDQLAVVVDLRSMGHRSPRQPRKRREDSALLVDIVVADDQLLLTLERMPDFRD